MFVYHEGDWLVPDAILSRILRNVVDDLLVSFEVRVFSEDVLTVFRSLYGTIRFKGAHKAKSTKNGTLNYQLQVGYQFTGDLSAALVSKLNYQFLKLARH